MASVASQLIEVTARAQIDSLEDAQEICTDSTYFLNNLRILWTKDDEIICIVLGISQRYFSSKKIP